MLPAAPAPAVDYTYSGPTKWTKHEGVDVMIPAAAVPAAVPDTSFAARADPEQPPLLTHMYFDKASNRTVEVILPNAIAPPHLRKRKEAPGPLFGQSGGPDINDIAQSMSNRGGKR